MQMHDERPYGPKNGTGPQSVPSAEDPPVVRAVQGTKQLKSRAAALNVQAYMLAHGLVVDSHPFSADLMAEQRRAVMPLKAKYLDLCFALRHQDLFECKISYCGIYQVGWRFTPIAAIENSGAFQASHALNQASSSQYINFGTNCSQDLTLNSVNSGWQPDDTWDPSVAPTDEQTEAALYLREYLLTLQDTYVQNTTIQLFYAVCVLTGKTWMQRVIRESRGAKKFCFLFPDFFLIHKGNQLRIMAIDPRIFRVGHLGTPDFILRGASLRTDLGPAVGAEDGTGTGSARTLSISAANTVSSPSSSSSSRSRLDIRRERVRNRAPKIPLEVLRSAAMELGVRNSNNTDVEKFDQSVFTCLPGFLCLYKADQARRAFSNVGSQERSANLRNLIGNHLYLETSQEASNSLAFCRNDRESIFEGEDSDDDPVIGTLTHRPSSTGGAITPTMLGQRRQPRDSSRQRHRNEVGDDSSGDSHTVSGIGDGGSQREGIARVDGTQLDDVSDADETNCTIDDYSKDNMVIDASSAGGDVGCEGDREEKGGEMHGSSSDIPSGVASVSNVHEQEHAQMEVDAPCQADYPAGDYSAICNSMEGRDDEGELTSSEDGGDDTVTASPEQEVEAEEERVSRSRDAATSLTAAPAPDDVPAPIIVPGTNPTAVALYRSFPPRKV